MVGGEGREAAGTSERLRQLPGSLRVARARGALVAMIMQSLLIVLLVVYLSSPSWHPLYQIASNRA